MRKLHVIGIGAGNPDYVTVQAINALNEVDVFFIPDKGAEKEELRQLRRTICERYITEPGYRVVDVSIPARDRDASYLESVDAWHASLAHKYEGLLMEHILDGECGGFLVWGDPSLYDSTLRIIERIQSNGLALDVEVTPGITSIQALAARHRIGLNRVGRSVAVMPGRCLAEGFPNNIDDVVVVLDGDRAYRTLPADEVDIFWGAYLGTEDECLVAGCLRDVMGEIERIRAEKKAAKGWVMDTYLLRRRGAAEG